MDQFEKRIVDRLYFGRDTPTGEVTAAAWGDFCDRQITPRFSKGYTIYEARGVWMGGHENVFVLEVCRKLGDLGGPALQDIADAYKSQFEQDAVLRATTDARYAFI